MQPDYLNDSSSMSYVAPVNLDISPQRTRSFSELISMPASPMTTDFSSLSTYNAMPKTDFVLNYSGGPSRTGFNFGSLGGLGFQANRSTIATPNLTGGMGGGGGSGRGWTWLNTRDQQGVLGPALAGAQALGSLYMGMKQYGVAKDQLAFQKDSFNKQFDANRSLTNSRLEDRQARRVLENPNATSVADYMSKWGVK
jgi:hypothetical protein